MVVHPSNGHYEGDTLVNALMARKDKLSSINGVIRPGIVHRIDKDTSGLLVVAKTDEAHLFLAEQLKDKTMYREYYALVEGIVPHELITIKAPIGKDKKDRLKQAVDPINGKDAVTHVTVLKRFKRSSLVSCKLETGRTHQIRLHLSYIKYPIIGDNVYGRKSHYYTSKGQMLHAYKLSFIHPLSKDRVTFVAPVDEEFLRVQEILENEFQIPMTEKLEEGVEYMCNLSDGVEQRGIEKEHLRQIKNKLEKNKSIEQIADELELEVSEVDKYIQLIQEQENKDM